MEDDDSNSNQNNLLDCLVQAQSFAFRQVHLLIIFNAYESVYIMLLGRYRYVFTVSLYFS
jgi:hypothetical protein